MGASNNGLKTFPPGSRWDLIDAISQLHLINDRPSQLGIGVNNSSIGCCNQLTKGSRNNCQYSICVSWHELTKVTKRQILENG